MASAQIFLSAVTAEFRGYRDALRRDLDRANVTVKVQEDFVATGTETLDKLDAYIRHCDAVIHLVGDMTGALAQAPSVAVLRQRYPDFAERLPVLGSFLPPDAPALSYTQWEAWLALYHRKMLVIAVPQDGAPRDERYRLDESQRAVQQAHLERLASVERYPEIHFANADRLAVDVLRSALQDILGSAGERSTGKPRQAPPLSDQYVERRDLYFQLKALAVPSRRDGSPSVTRIVLHGPGGAGKSVLASALAHDPGVQSVFPDGVLWASLGQGGDALQRLSDWGRALKDSTVGTIGYVDERTALALLRTLLNDRACLLVVDDVRDARSVKEAFLVGGRRCLLVVTTRLREVTTAIGATEVEVGAMAHEEAMALIERWTGAILAADRDTASFLADELGYLPLALELMGARVARLGSWTEYRRSWDTQRLNSLKRGRRARGKEENIEDSIDVSVQALPAADRDRYLQLAVLPQREYFPASAAAVLWGCPASEASELLLDFEDQALVSRRSKRGFDFTLANLFHEFVTSRLGEAGLALAHSAIVDGYRKLSPHGWPSGPNERYYFEHLSRHLAAGGKAAEVNTLITVQWMKASLVHTGTQRAFLADVARSMDLAAQQRPPGLEQLVRGALVHSTIATLAGHMPAAALAVLARAGHGERALAFAGVMQDSEDRHAAYVAIAEALLGRGEHGDAVVALERALDAVNNAYDRPAALADIARLASRAKSAALLERMLTQVGQSDAAASSAIALALGREGDQPRALDAARLCAAHARALGDDTPISERLAVLGAAVRALHAAGDAAEADHLADDAQAFADRICIDDDRVCAMALVQLARALADTGHGKEATDLATRAMGIVREVRQRASALPAVEQLAQAVNGDNQLIPQEFVIYAAAEVIKAIEDQPDEVAMARSQCARLIHAERVVEEAWAFEIGSEVLRALDRAGEFAAAHAVTAHLVNALGAMSGELREAALRQFVEGIEELQTEVVVSDVARKVLSLVERTTDAARRIRDLPELINAFGRSHDDQGFDRALDLAQKSGSELNGYALRSAVVVLCAKLELKRALAIRDLIESDDEYGIATAIIARCVAKGGDGALARRMVDEITDPAEQAAALADVAAELVESGKTEDAVDAANHAIATAQVVRTYWRDFTIPGLKVKEEIGGEQDQSTALMVIARTLASVKAVERALEVADVLTDPINQSVALSQIAVEMAEAGDAAAAAVARRAWGIAAKSGEPSDEDSTSDALVDDTAEAAPATDAPPEDQILGMLAALMDPQGRARVSSWVGSVLSQSSPDDGVAFAWRAVRAARSIPDRTRLADVIWDLVRVSARVDDEALEREVLALAEAFGNSRAASWLANERAEANRMRKEAEGRQFSVIGREARRAEALAWAANALGEAGVHDQVAATARTALDIATETRFEAVRLQVLLQLAQAYGATNDLQALRQLETSVPVLLSDPVSKINVACQIADAWARRDTGEELTHRVKQVLSALRTQEDKALQAAVWGFVGQVWRRAEDVTKAMDCARRAVSVAKAIPDEERRVAILSQVAHSVAIVGDVALANEAAEAAAATAERVCGARERALALAAAASALAEAGQDEIALGTLLRALSSSRPAQRDCIFQVVAAVAQTLGKLGMTEGVWSLFQAVQDDDTWWGPASTT